MKRVNCTHCDGNNKCPVKPRVFFGLFRQTCVESLGLTYNNNHEAGLNLIPVTCELAKRFERPPPPMPRKVSGAAPPPMPRPVPPPPTTEYLREVSSSPMPKVVRCREDLPYIPNCKGVDQRDAIIKELVTVMRDFRNNCYDHENLDKSCGHDFLCTCSDKKVNEILEKYEHVLD